MSGEFDLIRVTRRSWRKAGRITARDWKLYRPDRISPRAWNNPRNICCCAYNSVFYHQKSSTCPRSRVSHYVTERRDEKKLAYRVYQSNELFRKICGLVHTGLFSTQQFLKLSLLFYFLQWNNCYYFTFYSKMIVLLFHVDAQFRKFCKLNDMNF